MVIQSQNVWTGDAFRPAQIVCTDKITRIGAWGEMSVDADFGTRRIIPGMIDVHCHGAYGFDTNSADEAGLRRWAKHIHEEGVTAFLPTTVTADLKTLTAALRNVAAVKKTHHAGADGARIMGVHLEGPFISHSYPGAQPVEAILPPSVETFRQLQEAAEGNIRIITLAPEEDADFALTEYAAAQGVVVSMGHTAATYAQAEAAAAHGARSVTHTFNAQSPFSHRAPGVAGFALRRHDFYSEIICDCIHVSAEALHIFFTCKDKDHAVMVSDALLCKGASPGEMYDFAGHPLTVTPDGVVRMTDSGTIAGSIMRMNEGLRNLVEVAGVPFEKALNACTCNPASLIGMGDTLGRIAAGYAADFAVLEDDYRVCATFCAGARQ